MTKKLYSNNDDFKKIFGRKSFVVCVLIIFFVGDDDFVVIVSVFFIRRSTILRILIGKIGIFHRQIVQRFFKFVEQIFYTAIHLIIDSAKLSWCCKNDRVFH
uniref:Uncharacterized protein n=1 Tax=Romanomermis culicivorax TaxID=13658 RepID=A0A915KA71_ROMCU